MTAHPPAVRALGLLVFIIGSVLLAFSIVGLIPGDHPFTASSALFTQMLVNMLMLLVATIMASVGMFVFIYGGEKAAPESIED